MIFFRPNIERMKRKRDIPALIEVYRKAVEHRDDDEWREIWAGSEEALREIADKTSLSHFIPLFTDDDWRIQGLAKNVLDDVRRREEIPSSILATIDQAIAHKVLASKDLITLVKWGDKRSIEALLGSSPEAIRQRDEMKRSALHHAARDGAVEIIELLIRSGSEIEARDEYKWTPLHMAAEGDKAEAVKLLIDRGAEVDARDSDLRTALHRAAEHNSVNAIKVLLEIAPATLIPAEDDTGKTAKAVAVAMGHKEVVQIIEQYE